MFDIHEALDNIKVAFKMSDNSSAAMPVIGSPDKKAAAAKKKAKTK
jgi:hypothetical protein